MKWFFRAFTLFLFMVFFYFALKNTQEAVVHFFWDYEARGPLVLILFCFFFLGIVFGALSMTPTLFRHQRALSKQKKATEPIQNGF